MWSVYMREQLPLRQVRPGTAVSDNFFVVTPPKPVNLQPWRGTGDASTNSANVGDAGQCGGASGHSPLPYRYKHWPGPVKRSRWTAYFPVMMTCSWLILGRPAGPAPSTQAQTHWRPQCEATARSPVQTGVTYGCEGDRRLALDAQA